MAILGAHQSIAGGYYKAVEHAHRRGCECVQLFTKNNNQWRAKPISDDDVSRFRQALTDLNILHPIAHDSYLINLASPDDALWQRSIESFADELRRANRLGIPYLVTHPGCSTTTDEAQGLRRVIEALDEVHEQTRDVATRTLLETTAGQGSSLGWKFEHLATILDGVRSPERLGVCVDTCHIFAAGYAIGTEREYKETFALLDKIVGLDQVKAFHLNDSKRELGLRVDRHEHIGQGQIGLEAFRLLVNDRRFRRVPMYLETPKGEANGVDFDVMNLARLRGLVPARRSPRGSKPKSLRKSRSTA